MNISLLLEKEAVENLIPQKFPFVMIDRMFSYTETTLVSGLNIQEDNIFVKQGLFLEAGIIEHMAQSVALHTGYLLAVRSTARGARTRPRGWGRGAA